MTAAVDRTFPASGPSRPTLAPITSRMLSGRVISSGRCSATHRPVESEIDGPGFREVAQDLAHKKRVAVCLLIEGVGKTERGLVEGVPGGGLHEFDDAGVVKSGQLDTDTPWCRWSAASNAEERIRLWHLVVAKAAEHEDGQGRRRGDQMTQHLQATGVGPLQVVQDEHNGLALGYHFQKRHHGGEEEKPFGVSVGRFRRWEVRNSAGELGDKSSQLGPIGLDMGQELVLGCMSDIVAECLGE